MRPSAPARGAVLPLRSWSSRKGFRAAPTLLAALALTAGAVSVSDGLFIKAKAVVAQVLLERAWDETLRTGDAVQPWNSADMHPVLKIAAPRLKKSSIVLSGVSGQALAFGPGLIAGPAPGEPGLAIIAAHRDTHFEFLKEIKIGDVVEVTNVNGERLSFTITETRIVDANNSRLYAEGGAPRIALVTCWPFDAKERGAERFVAIGGITPPSSRI